MKEEYLQVICVPSSFQAKQLIIEHKLPLGDLNMYPEVIVVSDILQLSSNGVY